MQRYFLFSISIINSCKTLGRNNISLKASCRFTVLLIISILYLFTFLPRFCILFLYIHRNIALHKCNEREAHTIHKHSRTINRSQYCLVTEMLAFFKKKLLFSTITKKSLLQQFFISCIYMCRHHHKRQDRISITQSSVKPKKTSRLSNIRDILLLKYLRIGTQVFVCSCSNVYLCFENLFKLFSFSFFFAILLLLASICYLRTSA